MLLEGKNAVIYGGGGSIGGAVARTFAREGARVFLAGLTIAKLDEVAAEIRSAGGMVETARVEALDEKSVDEHAEAVADTAIRTTLLTTRAAARYMIRQKAGTILYFGGLGEPMRDYYIGGTQVGLGAIEIMRRQLAAELGPHGIRTVTLKTGGIPESIREFDGREAIVEGIEGETMLGRAATLEDVGNVAAFVATDHVRSRTAATVNISCGAIVD